MTTRTLRALSLGAVVAVTGCATRPDSDSEWQRLATDGKAARPYALDRIESGRNKAKLGKWTGVLAFGGALVCGYVTAWYSGLDDRDHWDAPYETWAGLTGASVGLGVGAWFWAGHQSSVADDWETALANHGKAPAAEPAKKPELPATPPEKPVAKPADEKPADPPAPPADPPKPGA